MSATVIGSPVRETHHVIEVGVEPTCVYTEEIQIAIPADTETDGNVNQHELPQAEAVSINPPNLISAVGQSYTSFRAQISSSEDKRGNLGIVCCGFFILIAIFVLPVVQIAYGAYYFNNASCNWNFDSFHGNFIPIWLIVNGVTTVYVTIANLEITANAHLPNNSYFVYFTILTTLFLGMWWWVGAFGFWSGCPNVEPRSINQLVYASLVIPMILGCCCTTGPPSQQS